MTVLQDIVEVRNFEIPTYAIINNPERLAKYILKHAGIKLADKQHYQDYIYIRKRVLSSSTYSAVLTVSTLNTQDMLNVPGDPQDILIFAKTTFKRYLKMMNKHKDTILEYKNIISELAISSGHECFKGNVIEDLIITTSNSHIREGLRTYRVNFSVIDNKVNMFISRLSEGRLGTTNINEVLNHFKEIFSKIEALE